MGPAPFYGARAEKPYEYICRLSGDITMLILTYQVVHALSIDNIIDDLERSIYFL